MSAAPRKLRYAMVGGGRDAFIGSVHRKAAALDGQIELVAGALSSSPDKARASGRDLLLADDRNHGDWQSLLADELQRPPHERIDFVSIVTPNHVHFPVAQAFVEAGFHVVCDKPLVHTTAEAAALVAAVARAGTVFGVTYNYTGYPMVRQAREMVKSGQLGRVRKVVVEYQQGWLATALEQTGGGNKQADWRTDPARSGAAGALGDIGTHAENLIHTITGLEMESLCADLGALVAGRSLDDDGTVLLRFRAAHAVRWSRRRSTPVWRMSCVCWCPARWARCSGSKSSPTNSSTCPTTARARSSRAAPLGCVKPPSAPAACPAATPRGLSKPLPTCMPV